MTGNSAERDRGFLIALALAAAGAFFIRAWPLFIDGWAVPPDYDEGVYFSAAALLAHRVLPYRDFVFVHPPGWLLALAPIAGWAPRVDPAALFAVARWAVAVLGAGNTVLAGKLGRRAGGVGAGIVAAVVYAAYPEAVAAERGPFLEPALNACCLGAALLLTDSASLRRTFGAGVLLGCAISIKAWGAMWLLAALFALPEENRRAHVVRLFEGAAAAVALLVLPFVAIAPKAFFDDAIVFQLIRPPDNFGRALRIGEIFSHRHLLAWVAGLGGAGWIAVHARDSSRAERMTLVAFVLTVLTFFLSRAYWAQYNAHLAASESVLAGVGAVALWRWAETRAARAAVALAIAFGTLAAFRAGGWASIRDHAHDVRRFIALAREQIPREASLVALEPSWALAAGRLPERVGAEGPLVDSYATMLWAGLRQDPHAPDARSVFAGDSSSEPLRARLDSCSFAALGHRADWQLSPPTSTWVREHFALLETVGNADLWRRIR